MNFGFKVVNQPGNEEIVEKILTHAAFNGNPVEVGLFWADVDIDFKKWSHAINYYGHASHEIAVSNFIEEEAGDIDRLVDIGAKQIILHLTIHNSPVPSGIMSRLEYINDFAKERNIVFLLENTYWGLDFYKKLFLAAASFQRIGFCCDLGHAKIYDHSTIYQWLDFAHNTSLYRPIHYHLHLNHGLEDEHLSFLEFEDREDWYVGRNSYKRLFASLDDNKAAKIFEVEPCVALENMEVFRADLRL